MGRETTVSALSLVLKTLAPESRSLTLIHAGPAGRSGRTTESCATGVALARSRLVVAVTLIAFLAPVAERMITL